MWLQKDERRLLEGYYLKIGDVDKEIWFDTTLWIPVMKSKPSEVKDNAGKVKSHFNGGATKSNKQGDFDPQTMKVAAHQAIQDKTRLDVANKKLEQRPLIKIHKHQSEVGVASISLTLTGYDLGRKYNSWWTRSGLWFAEYKDHWFWLIVSFLGGIIGALLVGWLSNVVGAE